MGKVSGSKRLKRQMAPAFWQMPRKEKRFAVKPSLGPHPSSVSYPLGILLRDVLKVVKTIREAKWVLTSGSVLVDGVARRDVHFPVGLMDVIEVPSLDKAYRMVPKDGAIVAPIEIPKEEKNLKLCKVTNKMTVSGKKLQYGLHDGRTLLGVQKASVNDTLLLTVPEQKVTDTVKIEKGSTVIVTSGHDAGVTGKVQEIRAGTFILPKRVLLAFKDKSIELPVYMVMAIGVEKPLVRVSE